MHKVYEYCKAELDSLIQEEMTPARLTFIGELVDICKDIKNIEYWEKAEHDEDEGHHEGKSWDKMKLHDKSCDMKFEELLDEFRSMQERAMNSGDKADMSKFQEDVMKMLDGAKQLKAIMSAVPMDAAVSARYKELFRS